MARVSKTSPFRTRGQAQSRQNARGEQREERPLEPQADEDNSSDAEENAQHNGQMSANRGKKRTRRIIDIYADERSMSNAIGRANISETDTSAKPARGTRGRRPYTLRSSPRTRTETSPKPVRGRRGRRPYALRSSYCQRPIMNDLSGDVSFEFVQRNADQKGKGKQQEETDVFEDSETDSEEACKRIKKEPKSDDDSDDNDGAGGGGGYGAHTNVLSLGLEVTAGN